MTHWQLSSSINFFPVYRSCRQITRTDRHEVSHSTLFSCKFNNLWKESTFSIQCSPIARKPFTFWTVPCSRLFVVVWETCRWKWIRSVSGMIMTGVFRKKKTPPSATFSTINLTWTCLGPNPLFCWQRLVNNQRPLRLRLTEIPFEDPARAVQ